MNTTIISTTPAMRITVPEFSMVLLIGASGSGKSTFARIHFKLTEIVSSDVCRGLVSDDENSQAATPDAFALLQTLLELRLKNRRLTVVDAMNVRSDDRKTGAAARIGLSVSRDALQRAASHGVPVEALLAKTESRLARAEAFSSVVRGYTWSVASVDDLKIAPFHLLASEGQVHNDKAHSWHMTHLARLAECDPLFKPTATLSVSLDSEAAIEAAIQWWLDLTASGGEGMVIKPADFIAKGRRGMVQPAIKCRGREYLRIIYGPDYDTSEHLERLRERALGTKRSMAFREFALGMEALDRFILREPLRRVHECVFGVLALESEPVDPRL